MQPLDFSKNFAANDLFDDRYVDTKKLFLLRTGRLPSVAGVHPISGEKAYEAFRQRFGELIEHTATVRWHHPRDKSAFFNRTVLTLSNGCVAEFDDQYGEILHDGAAPEFVQEATDLLLGFKAPARRQPVEINLIVRGGGGLELKALEIKRTRLDLGLFYEDDFAEVDRVIRRRLAKNGDRGIILLHGPPGTGKTTYLRHLIARIKKRVLFLSPSAAGDLMSPGFIELLIDNPNTVVIIEDAETIISDRRATGGHSSAVSNLLNISDGLLADFLNVQLICTFNSALTTVDAALLRKGRLIAKYEFSPLSVEKARRLSAHFGFGADAVRSPMTIAELANQHEVTQTGVGRKAIGFRGVDGR